MEISLEQLERGNPLDLPCFSFRGKLPRRDGSGSFATPDELRAVFGLPAQPFASALLGFAKSLADNERLKPELRHRRSTIVVPEVTFNCDPYPEAFTVVHQEGSVQVNFGFFLTSVMLARTIDWLNGQIARREEASAAEILSMEVPEVIVLELRRVLALWRSYEMEGICHYASIIGEVDPTTFARIELTLWDMCISVFFHEMGHWYQSVFRREVWDGLVDRTFQHLAN